MRRPQTRARATREEDRGAALVEFALVALFVCMVVFGVVDLSRAWQLQNRMASAAREAAASVELSPRSISSGCAGTQNAHDRAVGEDPKLTGTPGFSIEVVKVDGDVELPLTHTCGAANNLERGDTARVRVSADLDLITPLIGAITGDPISVARTVDVVVQAG